MMESKLPASIWEVDGTKNGMILKATRLITMAIRYFVGGDPADFCLIHNVSPAQFYESVWMMIDAIHQTQEFNNKFPSNYEMQQQMAAERFCRKSSFAEK